MVRLYLDWLEHYSELHFQVVGAVYNSDGITRGEIWAKIGKRDVRGGFCGRGFVQNS